MIKLKSGTIVDFVDNYDEFFQNLQKMIVDESIKVAELQTNRETDLNSFHRVLLKEIMDNSIYVTHQIFDISKINKNLSKFLVTGFLFNSIVHTIPELEAQTEKIDTSDDNIIQ
jgi:hypothetical protein